MAIVSKDPEEIITVTFPYAKEIGGATIDSAVVTMEVTKGADAGAAAMLNGAHQISGSNVLQSVRNGIDANAYKPRCKATLSDGRVLVRVLPLPVIRR